MADKEETKKPRSAPQLSVLGRTGLQQYSGIIDEEWHPRLRGTLAVRIYKEMSDNDPVIGSLLYATRFLMRQMTWDVQAGGETDRHKVEADFLKSAMEDMSITWQDFLSEALSMLVFGWSYFETLYKRRLGDSKNPVRNSRFNEGRIGWRKFSIRAQESLSRWEIDEEGGIQGLFQIPAPSYIERYIPIGKALLFRTETLKNNPEGRSILRNMYRSWYLLKRIQEHEAIGVARNLSGLPVLQVPPEIMATDASPDDVTLRNNLELLIQRIHRDEREGMLIPAEIDQDGKQTGYKFSLLTASGRPINTSEIITRYEQRIAMSVLAEFIFLGTQATGSYALASTKTALFAAALGGFADSMVDVINRFAVEPLYKLNGVPQEFWATVTHGDIEKADLVELSTFLANLSNAGLIVADEELESEVRRLAGLPQPSAPRFERVQDVAGEADALEGIQKEDPRQLELICS